MTTGNYTFISEPLEWRALAGLKEPMNSEAVYRYTEELFTNERKLVFDAIRQAITVYGEASPEAIERFLRKPYPQQLDVPVNPNLDSCIDELRRLATKRQLLRKAETLASIAGEYEPNLDLVQKELELKPIFTNEDSSLKPGSQKFLSQLHHKINKSYKFSSTGFWRLDKALGGEWPRKGITLVGATPGTGKTALALQSMILMAEQEIPSLMINLEMSKDKLIARAVANLTSIDYGKIKIGDLDKNEQEEVEKATYYLESLPMRMICNSDLDVSSIIGYIKEHINTHGIKVVFVDHLQLIKSSNDNRNNALGDITWMLKICADKYDLQIVLLSQLTDRGGKLLVRDSGEVDSKVETFLILSSDGDTVSRYVNVSFPKNRDGELTKFDMLFNGAYQRFTDGFEERKE